MQLQFIPTMDPISITTGCVSLIGTIGTFSRYIALFVSEVRNARKDMDAVYRELGSLSLCLESLRTDCSTGSVGYSKSLRTQLGLSLNNCDIIIQQMKDLLQKLQSNRLGRRIQWSLQCRDEMSKLQSALEKQKSCIEMALGIGSIQILSALKQNLESQRDNTAIVVEGMAALRINSRDIRRKVDILPQIASEMKALREEISRLTKSHGAITPQVESFVRDCWSDAEVLTNPFASELDEMTSHEPEAVQGYSLNQTTTVLHNATSSQDDHRRSTSQSSLTATETTLADDESQTSAPGRGFRSSPSLHTSEIGPSATNKSDSHPEKISDQVHSAPRSPRRLTPAMQLRTNNLFLMLFKRRIQRDVACNHDETSCPHIREMKQRLDEGADINFAPASSPLTPLLAEILHRDARPPIVRFLVENGASVADAALLRHAIKLGHVEVARILLGNGASVDDTTLLLKAVTMGHLELVRILLENGASVDDATPLKHAVIVGNLGLARILLQAGMPANFDFEQKPEYNCTSLMLAVDDDKTDLVRLLLEFGASVTVHDSCGTTPLHTAVKKANADNVKLLLDAGADPDTTCSLPDPQSHSKTTSALCDAIIQASSKTGMPNIVKLLVDAGADLELLEGQRRAIDEVPVRSPLLLAIQLKNSATVRVLVDAGADIEVGYALHAAVRKCSLDMTRILLESGADVDSVFGGLSAISYARACKQAADRPSQQFYMKKVKDWDNIIKTLKDYGADSRS